LGTVAFREHDGFTITTDSGLRRPKGVARKKKPKADAGFVRGDRITTTEQAIWLNPRFRDETIREIHDHLGR
jgi:hypothetical protein